MRSPRATCCLTASYSSAVSAPGLAQDRVRHADLAHVVEQPGDLDRLELLVVEADEAAEEHAVAGDVLAVALRVAVLAVDRDDEALEHVEARDRPASWPIRRARRPPGRRRRTSPPGGRPPPTARSSVTDRPSSGKRHTPLLTVIGRRSDSLELDADAAQRLARRLDPRLQLGDGVAGGDDQELVRAVAAHRHRRREVRRDGLLDERGARRRRPGGRGCR